MKKIFNIYLDCLKSSFFDLKRCPLLPVFIFLLFIAWRIAGVLFSNIPFLNSHFLLGFILGMLGILCITIFYYFISEAALGRKLKFDDLKNLDFSYFNPIISVAFVIFIFQIILQYIIKVDEQILIILNVLVFILFNPVPEVIITKRTDNLETFSLSFDFIKKNWISWFFPQIVLSFIFYLVAPFSKDIILNLNFNDILIPSKFLFFSNYYSLIMLFINFFLFVYFCIFRIHLFKRLD